MIVGAAVSLYATAANAGSVTNTMTNIVTVSDACDIVAVGVDFGLIGFPIGSSGVTSTIANTALGNAVTGNTSNPDAGKDGGAGNDDVLSLSTPLASVSTSLNSLLSSINVTAPGVYVACTVSPTNISVTSAASGATAYSLPTNLLATPSGKFNGQMTGIGGGATSSNAISYTLSFTGAPLSASIPPLSIFTASFPATGNIPATQTGTVVPGYYGDVAVARVDF
jgi:hypothetical protein